MSMYLRCKLINKLSLNKVYVVCHFLTDMKYINRIMLFLKICSIHNIYLIFCHQVRRRSCATMAACCVTTAMPSNRNSLSTDGRPRETSVAACSSTTPDQCW